ncbi:DUF3465 domain-containing protein [Shewanella sp. VB17]|uniref:DUF3465 domain-containing protein n=1 Tax=Shewanella sp. VB17 TaxID=2739432 RepID=UPI001565C9F7|nr:DUF3465 domain-containing protein [Shewanella sp. VB17]NRD73127.1 DUF3465 domain-containing protein [Shewanella sp. VB17]
MQKKILKGTLVRWRDDKGFGFIEPELIADQPKLKDVFIHASRLTHMSRRPLEGDIIFFQLEHKPGGKLNAIEARIDGVEVKSDVKLKQGLRSQEREYRGRERQVIGSIHAPTKGLLFRVGIMMLLLAGASFAYNKLMNSPAKAASVSNPDIKVAHDSLALTSVGTAHIAKAYQQKLNGVQVNAIGTVIKLLADDDEGSRHQRFILRLPNQQTLLVAHNIDLAPRIKDIGLGDSVEFNGQYEFNDKGGIIHWTHHDPQAHHLDGWLKHNGQIYQ